MYILYVDESGDPSKRHTVYAGVGVYEHDEYFLTSQMNEVASSFFPKAAGPIFLHAHNIFTGQGEKSDSAKTRPPWEKVPWDVISESNRQDLLKQLFQVLENSSHDVQFFAVSVDNASWLGQDPIEPAFETLCVLFDSFLKGLYKAKNRQKGLVVLSKPQFERRFSDLLARYRSAAKPTGRREIVNLIDVPVFTASAASRMLQAADLVSWAVYRYYEQGEDTWLKPLLPHFGQTDPKGKPLHLRHLTGDVSCSCFAQH